SDTTRAACSTPASSCPSPVPPRSGAPERRTRPQLGSATLVCRCQQQGGEVHLADERGQIPTLGVDLHRHLVDEGIEVVEVPFAEAETRQRAGEAGIAV